MTLAERGKRLGQADKDDTTRIEELERRRPVDPTEIIFDSLSIINPPGGVGSKTITIPHTWAVLGTLVAYTYPGMFVRLGTFNNMSARLIGCRYKLASGTSITAKVTQSGVDVTGLTALSVTPTAASTTLAVPAILAHNDLLTVIVSAPTGTPVDLSFTIFIEYSF